MQISSYLGPTLALTLHLAMAATTVVGVLRLEGVPGRLGTLVFFVSLMQTINGRLVTLGSSIALA